jgi:hypothetical protein
MSPEAKGQVMGIKNTERKRSVAALFSNRYYNLPMKGVSIGIVAHHRRSQFWAIAKIVWNFQPIDGV